jgi:hypothetical protein
MKFKEFLIEASSKPVRNEVDIIYQSILDNLDDGHIDMGGDKLSFNVGKIMKNSKYNNLDFVVRRGEKVATRLGKDTGGKSALVVDTKGKIPTRQKIIGFLNDAENSKKIKQAITKYLDKHHDYDAEVEPATSYEKTQALNTEFEDGYTNLIKAIDKRIENHNNAKGYLTDKHNKTANVAQREISQAAMRKLFDDEIGGSFDAFKSIVLKLPEAEFIKKLVPEAKNKVLTRLESYYDHKSEEFSSDDSPNDKKKKDSGKK